MGQNEIRLKLDLGNNAWIHSASVPVDPGGNVAFREASAVRFGSKGLSLGGQMILNSVNQTSGIATMLIVRIRARMMPDTNLLRNLVD